MFTGIIECIGRIVNKSLEGSNIDFEINAPITDELKPDQSVAHNGVCLTVTDVQDQSYHVTAVKETLDKTALGKWEVGDGVNIERAMKIGDRLDGHFVQGHIDTIATCTKKTALDGSWLFSFSFPEKFAALIIEKGSVCINGISLTAFDVQKDTFTVTIIPYTYNNTTFNQLEEGMIVNIEFDILGKYLLKASTLNQ